MIMLAKESIENEPQINADERRLNASYQENIFATSEKDCETGNAGIYQTQSGKIRKSLTLIINKSDEINLRLSAFICGLKKSYHFSQSNYSIEKYKSLFLFNLTSISFFVNLRLIKNYKSFSIIIYELFGSEKDGISIG